MLDRHVRRVTSPALERIGGRLAGIGIPAGAVTATGWVVGAGACAAAATATWPAALALWLANRVIDGLDGPVARARRPTAVGGFFDILSDFSIYGGFVVAVAIAVPPARLACAVLLFTYYLSGSALLALSSLLERQQGPARSNAGAGEGRSLHAAGGLAEGSETVIVYTLFCLLPGSAPGIAWGFAAAVALTAVQRIVIAARVLDDRHRTSWPDYLERFHAAEPGITDDILRHARSQRVNAYQWLVEPLPDVTRLLDLACGNAPVHGLVDGSAWVGVDRSAAELRRAREVGARPLIRSEASALPFPSGTFDGFVCSMALMLFDPLEASLAELRRVVQPGATGVITIPGTWPLTPGDLWRYGRLMASLRLTHLRYPNDRPLLRLHRVMARHGFDVVSDQRRRFAYTVSDGEAADRFVRSLYLPGVPETSIRRAETTNKPWAGQRVGIPLRRIVVRAA